jgi:branched-chain amino acid transport system ATP-binding protein
MSGIDSVFAALGTSLWVFVFATVVLFGWAAYMAGQALAQTWRPVWHLAPYSLLLAAGNRFFDFALFGGSLLSLPGYLVTAIILFAFSIMAYRATQARKMVNQYPWLYERAGPFAWRDRQG